MFGAFGRAGSRELGLLKPDVPPSSTHVLTHGNSEWHSEPAEISQSRSNPYLTPHQQRRLDIARERPFSSGADKLARRASRGQQGGGSSISGHRCFSSSQGSPPVQQTQQLGPPISREDLERRALTRRLVHSIQGRSLVGIDAPPTLEIRPRSHSPTHPGGPVDPASWHRVETAPGDNKERKYLERLDHLRKMDRSLDGKSHKELFGGGASTGRSSRTPWNEWMRSEPGYKPHQPVLTPRVQQELQQQSREAGAAQQVGQGLGPGRAHQHDRGAGKETDKKGGSGRRTQADAEVARAVALPEDTEAAQVVGDLLRLEDQLGSRLAAHTAATNAQREAMLASLNQKDLEERHKLLDEIERVRAAMGIAASRAPRPTQAEKPRPAADAVAEEVEMLRKIRMEANDEAHHMPTRSGCLMATPLNEQKGRHFLWHIYAV